MPLFFQPSTTQAVLRDLGRSYEIVLVDDGSKDGTRQILRTLAAGDPHLRIVLFRRNYGQTAAMAAGIAAARGEILCFETQAWLQVGVLQLPTTEALHFLTNAPDGRTVAAVTKTGTLHLLRARSD